MGEKPSALDSRCGVVALASMRDGDYGGIVRRSRKSKERTVSTFHRKDLDPYPRKTPLDP